jgi:hypothetical protein
MSSAPIIVQAKTTSALFMLTSFRRHLIEDLHDVL